VSSVPNTPPSPPEDDVQRLLKQMNMAAFRFKSFDRPGDHEDGSSYDAAAPIEAAETPVAPRKPPVTAAAPAPAAVAPKLSQSVAAQQVRGAAPVDEAFGRLIRQTEPRARRNSALRLDLPVLPRIVEVKPVASGELLVAEVLNRLYRLGASAVSLIRPRGEA